MAAAEPIALAVASGFVLADDGAWCEHLAVGGVYTVQHSPGAASAIEVPLAPAGS